MLSNAIYPGSFDPPTLGHLNIVERGLKIFKKITIAVAINTSKAPLLSCEARVELLKDLFKKYPNVEVDSFEGLLVNYAKKQQTGLILRGVRTVADFEYELQMSFANKKLWSEIETIFIMTESRYSHISSSIIKEIAKFGGSLTDMVPPNVEKKLLKK
ncbi:MAG: pantetheine-phosphate adenylyltransferase [Deltaproteobacteria bacterium]|nr:pantetheine-phosphate adenylyltransferase [Deltaproteobacteria bacterium]